MTQTAVDWLIEQLKERGYAGEFPPHLLFEQSKEMEKQQIIDAWNGGDYAYFYSKEIGKDFEDGEQYYNEKYGK